MPEVHPQLSDIVVFLAYRAGGEEVAGTAFLLSAPRDGWDPEASPPDPVPGAPDEAQRDLWLVTARHVIEGIERESEDGTVIVWVNTTAGGRARVHVPVTDWIRAVDDPADGLLRDVAVLRFSVEPTYALRAFPIEAAATRSRIAHARIVPGADVVYPSLFFSRPGDERNVPLVRVGSLAALADDSEPFYIEAVAKETVSHIVEARSYRGVSGSPVFAVLPVGRSFTGETKHGAVMRISTRAETYLMGVMVTHWDLRLKPVPTAETWNLGLAVVMPVEQVIGLVQRST